MSATPALRETLQRKSVRKRPAKEFESPLRSFHPNERDTPFEQCVSVFSVDISGSTDGKVLGQEIRVVQKAVSHLSKEARKKCCIIPWDSEAHEIISPDELDRLDAAGGTNPNAMLKSDQHLQILTKADLWFLLTDGGIDLPDVRNFASELGRSGLHNKACILVLFGYHYQPPFMANISVGVSVYAAFPDCLFLFHDVVEGNVYILQSKGCFDRLGRTTFTNPIINQHTQWHHLDKFDYSSLQALRIPPRQHVGANEVLLRDRSHIDLEKVFKGQLTPEQTTAIFSDEQNLNSVLLTASTRGDHEHVTKWLSEQRRLKHKVDLRTFNRTDVGGHALSAIRKLCEAQTQNKADDQRLHEFQSALRRAHRVNWLAFATAVDQANCHNDQHDFILKSALEKMKLVSQQGFNSPLLLSPSDRQATITPSSATAVGSIDYSAIRQPWSPSFTSADLTQTKSASPLQTKVQSIREQISFIPGFSVDNSLRTMAMTCSYCGEMTDTCGIILKAPPANISTSGFAPPNSRSEIRYPQAVAGYPETDIIALELSCDSCAYSVSKHGLTLRGEEVVGVLPLSVSLDDKENERRWLQVVAAALQHRFSDKDLHAVMIGILRDAACTFRMSRSNDSFKLTVSTILSSLESKATILRATGIRSSIRAVAADFCQDGLFPLAPFSFKRRYLASRVAELLQHPIESFTSIVIQVQDMKHKIGLFFMRILWQIMEETISHEPETRKYALQFLKGLEPQPKQQDAGYVKVRDYMYTVDFDDLVKENVMHVRTLLMFQVDTALWDVFTEACLPALHSCLWKFAKLNLETKSDSVHEIFGFWLGDQTFVELCDDPRHPTAVVRWAYSSSGVGGKPALRLSEFSELHEQTMERGIEKLTLPRREMASGVEDTGLLAEGRAHVDVTGLAELA